MNAFQDESGTKTTRGARVKVVGSRGKRRNEEEC